MTAPQDPFSAPDDGSPPQQGNGQPPAFGGQPGFGAPAYGTQPYGTGAATPRNGLGTAALVLGILAVVLCWTIVGGALLGIAAIVLGIVGRSRARRGEATNGGSAIAGLVLGVIGLLLSAALVAAGVSLINSDDGKELQDCLRSAGNDSQAQESCQAKFRDNLSN